MGFKCFAVRFGREFTFVWPPLWRVLRCVYVTLSHLLNKTIVVAGCLAGLVSATFSLVSAQFQLHPKPKERERDRSNLNSFALHVFVHSPQKLLITYSHYLLKRFASLVVCFFVAFKILFAVVSFWRFSRCPATAVGYRNLREF